MKEGFFDEILTLTPIYNWLHNVFSIASLLIAYPLSISEKKGESVVLGTNIRCICARNSLPDDDLHATQKVQEKGESVH
jgi:hypothetical protein